MVVVEEDTAEVVEEDTVVVGFQEDEEVVVEGFLIEETVFRVEEVETSAVAATNGKEGGVCYSIIPYRNHSLN